MVLHQLIDDLTKELNLTEEQQFRVTAKIKRLIHAEKQSVYQRYAWYGQGFQVDRFTLKQRLFNWLHSKIVKHTCLTGPKDPWLNQILSEADKNHREWMTKSDEEIVTWDIGSHKFFQRKSK